MPVYPPVNFYFRVIFKGGGISSNAAFREISGLSVDIGKEDVSEGGLLGYAHQLPKPPTYKPLVLRRGLAVSSSLRTWVEDAIVNFKFTPITATVSLLNAESKPTMMWVLHNVRPSRWQVSDFNSEKGEVVIEELELLYDYFEIKPGSK